MSERIHPFETDQVSVDSYDVRLSNHFFRFNYDQDYNKITKLDQFDSSHKDFWKEVNVEKEQVLYLKPKEFILASTIEWIDLSHNQDELGCYSARLEGKSSIARNGIIIHNAGHIEPGFQGNITLEIYNLLPVPVSLSPGQLIGQLIIERLDITPERFYSKETNHYMGQFGTTLSASYSSKNMFAKTSYDFNIEPYRPITEK